MNYIKTFLLFLFIFLLSPSITFANSGEEAGFVIAARGDITATDASGSTRTLERRSKFYSEDVIKTGSNSSAQLRFKDRAMMRLKESSELVISDYHYGGQDDDTNTVIMNLISGGFRTIHFQIRTNE